MSSTFPRKARPVDPVSRYERLQKWLRRGIALILFMFLVGLANRLMMDVDAWHKPPAYAASPQEVALRAKAEQLSGQVREHQRTIETYRLNETALQHKLDAENASYRAWIGTRTAVQSADDNAQVRDKTRGLDALLAEKNEWTQRIDGLQQAVNRLNQEAEQVRQQLQSAETEGSRQYQAALRLHELKQFGLRLAFALPILLVGIFAFLRYRNHAYSPIAWGFILFSLYTFFVGLVPYLPDYGGYVRYLIGIVLTVSGGVYAIKQASRYAARKRAELEASREDRARRIDREGAQVSFQAHRCPSCSNDWTVGALEDRYPGHCFSCGIPLFQTCQCGKPRFAFFPYCYHCGRPAEVAGQAEGA